MARVYFTKRFDYYPLAPSKTVLIAFEAGQEYTVKDECAKQAIAAKAGVRKSAPRRRTSGD